MESLNRMAIELVDEAIDFTEELDIGAFELENGATVLDFGVDHAGGLEAGMLLAEIQTAGLATIQTGMGEVAGAPFPNVELACDRPAFALLLAQKAGWELSVDGFEGLGSGPARALVAEEDEYRQMGYTDAFEFGVLSIEADELPTEAVAEHVADMAEIDASGVFLPTFATASIAGSVSTAARAAELAVFRLFERGYDPYDILSVSGSAPVAPVAGSEGEAMGRTNDALAYGGSVHMTVREDSDAFSSLASNATDQYGTPFVEIFSDAEWDFAEIDPDIFAPARVTVDVVGGDTYAFGSLNESLLAESFGLDG